MKSKDFINEKWSDKYKRSINCASPKGFSQKAHCAGRNKNESADAGISKDDETKFHAKLDKLVHDTFGKRKDEMEEGVAEGAPELLKAEMPLVRRIEQELTKIGYKKGTPEFNAYFNDAIKFYRKFGNFGFNKEQGVAEDSETHKYQVVVKGDKRSYSVWVEAKNEEVAIIRAQQYVAREHNDTAKRAAVVDMKQGVKEFAQDNDNRGDDDEGFSPEIAKMAQEDGFTKGVSLADGATLERAMKINYWHTQHGGMYKQYFAKGFKAGRMNKVKHDNKQYNLNLKLMKDGSIRHGEQGVAEGDKKPHPKTWHDVDPELGKQVDKMSQAEKVKKGLAHPDTLKKKKEQGVAEGLRGTGNPGMPTPYDQGRDDAKKGRAYDNPYDQPGEEQEHSQYKKGYEQGKKQGVAEADKHSMLGKIQRHQELKKKVDTSFADIGKAQKQGDHTAASKAFRKHERYANLERPGTWTKVDEQGVAEGSLVDKQVAYWDSVAKDKKNKERETLKAKKERHEQTPVGKAEKYWSKKGVAEGMFGIDPAIKGKIQNITMDLSDIPGYWDHEQQTFTDMGLAKLKATLKKPEYVKYALNLTSDDYDADLREADAELAEPPERPRKQATKTKPDIKFDIPFQQDQDQPLAQTDPLDDLKRKAGIGGDKPRVDIRKASQQRTLDKTAGISSPEMGDMLSRLRNIEVDPDLAPYDMEPPEDLPSVEVNTQNLPAVAGQAIQAAGMQNPEFHQVANLPGNMSDQIRQLGKSLFGSLTMTPTKRIYVVANLGGQGPNTNQEVQAVAGFLKKEGKDLGPGNVDFEQVMPGYKADTHMFSAAGIRWMLVKDFAGQYIYCWPESDSHDAVDAIGNDTDTKRLK